MNKSCRNDVAHANFMCNLDANTMEQQMIYSISISHNRQGGQEIPAVGQPISLAASCIKVHGMSLRIESN